MKVETGIEIPRKRPGRNPKYPWAQCGIGDSFLVELGRDSALVVQRRVAASAASQMNRHGEKFITRIVDGGVRVWRVR